MPSLSFLSSSLFLLQALAPVVLGAAIPDDYYPPPHESPDPPARDCDAAGCRDPTWNLDDATLIPDKENVWIITFGRPGKYQEAAKPDINKILSDYLSTSLPYLLNQLSLDKKEIPTLVKDGVPLLIKAVTSITQQKDAADAKKLQEWSRKVEPKSPCGAFAAAAVSAYLVAFDAVYFANNPNGVPTTNDLDYFLMPAYGSMSHDNDMTVHYNAKFPDFFSSQKSSTNVDRNVYVRMDESAAKYRASPSSAGNPDFKKLAHVLLRQFGQVKQWAALDFLDTGFEIRYLKEYCKVRLFRLFEPPPPPPPMLTRLSRTGQLPLPRQPVRKRRGQRLQRSKQTPRRPRRRAILRRLDPTRPVRHPRLAHGSQLLP